MSKKKVKIPVCKKFEKECNKYWCCKCIESKFDICMCAKNYKEKVVQAYEQRRSKTELATGIVPIVKEIERVIHSIHDRTDELVNRGRTELRAAWAMIRSLLMSVFEISEEEMKDD